MFKIDSDRLYITRGDTGRLTVSIRDQNGNKYTPSSDEIIVMTVKKSVGDESSLFSAQAKDCEIVITPEYTKSLAFGEYVYDVQITLSNGDINTIIPSNKFIVYGEVT